MKHPAQATGQEREFPQAGIIWALPGGPRQLEPVQSRAGGPRVGSCLSLPSGPWSSGRLPSSSALFLFCAEKAPRDLLTITLTLGCFGRFFLPLLVSQPQDTLRARIWAKASWPSPTPSPGPEASCVWTRQFSAA